tara:strand:+ start:49 stop:1002 length:954 start_codon:yes stop_codon:yes gene_type:complete
MILDNNIHTQLPDDTISIIKNLIKYQNEKLIKHIAKEKGWDEQELLQEFLVNSNNSNNYINIINTKMSTNTEKKKSLNLNMDKINDSDSDSINSLVLSQFDSNNVVSPPLSQSSSCQSLQDLSSSSPKKKRGRPKKNTSAIVKPDTEKKKRGRPKKNKETDQKKLEQPKRKRGRPKKNVEKAIINDPDVDLQEDLTDQDSIELLSQHDQKLYQEKEKKIKEVVGSLFNNHEKNQLNENLTLKVNEEEEEESILSEESDDESDVEYEEITCETIMYQNVRYLINPNNNNVYSMQDDNKYIGRYNKQKSVIDFNAIESN